MEHAMDEVKGPISQDPAPVVGKEKAEKESTVENPRERRVQFFDRTRCRRVYTRERLRSLQSQLWYSTDEIRANERREQRIVAKLVPVAASTDEARSQVFRYEEEGLTATKEDDLCLFGLESMAEKKLKRQRIRDYRRRFLDSQGRMSSIKEEAGASDENQEETEERERHIAKLSRTEHVQSAALAAFQRGLKQAQSVSELCHGDLMAGMQMSGDRPAPPGQQHERPLLPLNALDPRSSLTSYDISSSHAPSFSISASEGVGKASNTITSSSASQAMGGGPSISTIGEKFSNDADEKVARSLKQSRPPPHGPSKSSPKEPPRKSPRRAGSKQKQEETDTNEVVL
eukprot:scaffold3716_cov69-Cylindrotheca_fusiformis.AAC.2